MKLVLLPGMDGTGKLFAPFIHALPNGVEPVVLGLPSVGLQNQVDLARRLASELPSDEDFFLLGESFSGRIAFELARAQPPGLKGVIYAASFLVPPNPRLLPLAATLPLTRMIKHPPASGAARHMMLGRHASAMWPVIKDTVARVQTGLISDRLKALSDTKPPTGASDLPSLHLRPTRDRLVGHKAADSIDAYNTNLKTVAIEGPHFLLQARPEICADEVMAFLKSAR
ncbi:alpha/beta fold hydrolase [Kordiimonas lacus]|uniref:Pimeloyl-ACP methyl ester carboxylesterase n=1 Tax=Kordiimonas lacus TaxID=637679 RepID=A0A1G7E3Q9_9PROT|nr:alpha/beta hydrolase [Kordiimonas lacus]SDE58302.1 Pimeloyl-ACP methyl ester carboxylesterase [Kordiimonas lacus]